MELIDFRKGVAWGIIPSAFESIADSFMHHYSNIVDGELPKSVTQKMAQYKETGLTGGYDLDDGIATISINGPLTKRDSFWSWFFGGSSYESIGASLDAAVKDPEVNGILLSIDSPGGVVNGVDSLSEKIFAARSQKPIVAFADGLMASAAYWIGSAADVLVGSKTAEVGSIGVLMVHNDYSRMLEKRGIKMTYLTAGKYKAVGNPSEPLTETARAVLQDELDSVYSIFLDSVARNRSADVETVSAEMADGKIFIGTAAVEVGLLDDIGSSETAIDMIRTMADDSGENTIIYIPRGASVVTTDENELHTDERTIAMPNDQLKFSELTIDILLAENSGLVKQIQDETKANLAVKHQEQMNTQQQKHDLELERITGLATAYFGEEKAEKFLKLVKSGLTVEQYEAVAGGIQDDSEKESKRDEMLDEIKKAGAEDVETAGNTQSGQDFMQLVRAYKKQTGCTINEAILAIRRDYPDSHDAYLKNVN